MTTSVLVVEEQPLVRSGIRRIVESLDIDQIQECENGSTAWRNIAKFQPDIAIISSDARQMGILEIASRLVNEKHKTRMVAVVKNKDIVASKAFLDLGVSCLIGEDIAANEMSVAIEKVLSGQTFICDSYKDDLSSKMTAATMLDTEFNLSARELDVLECVAQGNPNKEISFILNISIRTVEAHRRQIRLKTGTKSVADMTLLALKLGLVMEWDVFAQLPAARITPKLRMRAAGLS